MNRLFVGYQEKLMKQAFAVLDVEGRTARLIATTYFSGELLRCFRTFTPASSLTARLFARTLTATAT